ncbi:MAG: STAS domain-containing protein [Candidatus Riflebacteria bacterium]|nr:STAS domain-containing protein [Candidatus Riflebacteria bacterium]
MKIATKVDDKKRHVTFALEGELDVHQVKGLKSTISEAIVAGDWSYAIDLAKVGYLDSSGLGMLVYLKKEITRQGGRLQLLNVAESIRSVFQLTRLDEFFGLK